MVAHIQLFDETASGERTPALTLELPSEQVTLRQLIAGRVRHEVEQFNAEGTTARTLVRPTDAELTLNGWRLSQPRQLDAERQVRVACEAFDRNGFFVLVDDRQAESLDETLQLHADTVVSFVRLVPLVGG